MRQQRQQRQQEGPPGLAMLAQLSQAGLMQDPMEQMKGIMGLFAAINQMENSDANVAIHQQQLDQQKLYQSGMLNYYNNRTGDPEMDDSLKRAMMLTQLLQGGAIRPNQGVQNIFDQANMPGLFNLAPQQGSGNPEVDMLQRQQNQWRMMPR